MRHVGLTTTNLPNLSGTPGNRSFVPFASTSTIFLTSVVGFHTVVLFARKRVLSHRGSLGSAAIRLWNRICQCPRTPRDPAQKGHEKDMCVVFPCPLPPDESISTGKREDSATVQWDSRCGAMRRPPQRRGCCFRGWSF